MDIQAESESLESSASYKNILQFPLRNFTKVATIRYTNYTNSNLIPTKNTYSSVINTKSNKNKPALTLTLSLKPPFTYNSSQKISTEQPNPLEVLEEATTSLVTHHVRVNETLNSFGEKPYNILDRLRNLTNHRLKNREGKTFRRFGGKTDGLSLEEINGKGIYRYFQINGEMR